MVKILARLFCLVIIVVAVSCETNKIDSPRQLLAKEQERLQIFLDSIPTEDNPDKLNFKDLWTQQAVDTIDRTLETGMIYFEMETGTGDVVSTGKEVGIRYNRYVIATDSAGNVGLFWHGSDWSNYGFQDPDYYVVGGSSSTQPAGVQEAVKLMRKYGKCKVIIPSTLANTGYNSSYQTSIYDIEVTYLSK